MLYQQGDVLFTDAVPDESALWKKAEGHVLARGEATGHAHVALGETEVVERSGRIVMIRSDSPFTVSHDEHHPITIPAGTWEVNQVREYDHFAEEARTVRD